MHKEEYEELKEDYTLLDEMLSRVDNIIEKGNTDYLVYRSGLHHLKEVILGLVGHDSRFIDLVQKKK